MKDKLSEHTVFHITHHKAGSQWVRGILSSAAGLKRVKEPKIKAQHITDEPLQQGAIYPTVYMTKGEFDEVLSNNQPLNYKSFYVIRDLRDTLVSLYFSLRYSHVVQGGIAKRRAALEKMDEQEGMLHLINSALRTQNEYQTSWLGSGIRTFKYEDLIADEKKSFSDILVHCGIDIDDKKLDSLVNKNTFKSLTGGRTQGDEDKLAHQRKGISGDWKTYFTDEIKDQFKEKYSDTLIKTGYEKDSNW